MTLLVDASALVAFPAGEPERAALADRMSADELLLSSALACRETVAALRRSYGFDIAAARREVERASAEVPMHIVAIGTVEPSAALDAYERYGKGRHPAHFNMGGCFAYACARTTDARLLYKGKDFAKTDLA